MFRPIAISAILATGLSACTAVGLEYCRQQPETCALVGLKIIGGVILIAISGGSGAYYVSDSRLKTDIQPAGVTESGVPIYAFRYLGNSGYFVGPLAEELQTDPRFAHAVTTGDDGYLRVDFSALSLGVINGQQMAEAGERALRVAAR